MNTLSERLAKLSEMATPGPCRLVANGTAVAGKRGTGIILRATEQFMCRSEREANAALAYELVNAYRAGRLIVKDEAHD